VEDRTTELRGLPAAARLKRLNALISEQTKLVFGMKPDDPLDEERGLFQMGMNSLMSVQLKRRLETELGLKLPGTLTLTYPSVRALTSFLDTKLNGGDGGTTGLNRIASPATRKESSNVAGGLAGKTVGDVGAVIGMDESETDAAIAAELAALQQRLGAH
jgi:acyl carrier protein